MSSRKIRVLVVVGSIAAVWALLWAGWPGDEGAVPIPESFSVKNLRQKNTPEETEKLIAQYNELTEEQRQQVHKNKERAARQGWDERLAEYFNAAADERIAILDRHIDELVAEEKRYEKEKKEKQQDQDSDEEQKSSEKRPDRKWTTQQRKAKSESASADYMARVIAYKSALMDRARARGLNIWGGGK